MSEALETHRHWWWVFGPWRLRPLLLTTVYGMFFLAYISGFYRERGLLEGEVLTSGLIPGLILALIVFVIAWLGRRWQDVRGVHWPSYIVVIVLLSVVGPSARAIGFLPSELPSSPVLVLTTFVRALIVVVTISTIIGAVLDRLEREVAATQEALDLAREQQVQLLTADEESRRQASLVLHDRVQAGLIASCLELRDLARRLPEPERAELLPLIDRLEAMRSIDVRRAARSLSPNLVDVDFRTAVEELSMQYETVFRVDLAIDPALDRTVDGRDPQTLLAAYRIIDQSLLNAAAHSGASAVAIAVIHTPDGCFVRVADDGIGPPEDPVGGLGSTIMTAWARASNGTWAMERGEDGRGTVVTARLSNA